jgi:hypothetical protein
MPASTAAMTPAYVERLRIPARWWPIATVCVLIGGAEVFVGFPVWFALVVYAVLGIPTALFLIAMTRTKICVDADGLHAGGHLIARSSIAGARALGAEETRRRLGPQADTSASTFIRGYVKTAVLVQVRSVDGPTAWLVSTRQPEALVAALQGTLS